ncbi:MAG TPA: pyrroloquinoline quinone biosynthesis protein PqqE [Gammaproteobacteria bacterium]|jgi:pyrroloquinoline quinone biosynthesis protein E|nr:pyrroloquinoline quinone biosynthesis protein PqqE [Gammaproteobacteria bacterium]|tara:strand:+ start:7 stop:1176 length:1170 start_codon:yes stop_codon:yes gene_type:complete
MPENKSGSPQLRDEDNHNFIPMWLLAELTYACPVQCPYCSNPLQISANRKQELTTEQWIDVLSQARELGAVQLGFSGGEPLVRPDLAVLIQEATRLGFYTNLITSAIGLDAAKIAAFKAAGLNHIQISFQGSNQESNKKFGGTDSFRHKMEMTGEVIRQEIPLGLNFVLHRQNIHQIGEFLETAELLGAEFVELANTQYYGWAKHNQQGLLPSRKQVEAAERVTNEFRSRHKGNMDVFFVAPDYYDDRPKKCSNGWATTFITVTPEGDVLPCHAAKVIPGLDFPNVKQDKLSDIWRSSDLFNKYRGTNWMVEPCASCPERMIDLGGCRCQALMLTGDAANADPVCSLSPFHDRVTKITDRASREFDSNEPVPLLFRNMKNAEQFNQDKS